MYILELCQGEVSHEIGLFHTIEDGRKLISQLEGYKYEVIEGFEYEYFDPTIVPDYVELKYNGHIVPFTTYMFTGVGRVDIYWKEIVDLSISGNGMIEGTTRVDAYSIPNDELKDYIEKREYNYRVVKENLEEQGYEVERAYFGSEDGEAILYRDTGEWHFLTHMDPDFVESEDIIKDLGI